MTASAVNLRSVRLDQRRVAALLGASRQVPVPPLTYPKVTIDNLFKSRFYRELEKRGDGDVSESKSRLEVQSKHLQSYYNLRKNVEKGVSKRIEAIRNRAEEVEGYLEKEEEKRQETKNKRKKRKVVIDKEERETWSKLKGRRNNKTAIDEVPKSNSNKQWTWNNLGDLKASSNVLPPSQLSMIHHDNSKESQLPSEGLNRHLHEITPFRLPKLQIPVGREGERETNSINQKQLHAEYLPSLSSSSPSWRKETFPVSTESIPPDTQHSSRRQPPVGGIPLLIKSSVPDGEDFSGRESKNIKPSHSQSQRATERQKNTRRRKKVREKSSPEYFQSGDLTETRLRTTEERVATSDNIMDGATEEGYLKVGELSLQTENEIVNHNSSEEYDRMSADDEYADRQPSKGYRRSPTIRKKIPSRIKWDPNSHSETMRRKLNSLMRKRRLAKLDRIRLGQLEENDQAIETPTDSGRTVQVLYESAPEFGKTGNIITKERGRRKSHVTSTTTSRAFSYSYFDLTATGK